MASDDSNDRAEPSGGPTGAHRARDPGVRLGQLGRVTWVHCPRCNGPAKLDANGAKCLGCGYTTIQQTRPPEQRWARIKQDAPLCSHCRAPLKREAMPTARMIEDVLHVRVKCPACRVTQDYRAEIAFPPDMPLPEYLPRFLTTQVGGETLWVDNLAHLAALEEYLGALVRERGEVSGLTMMARLPAWMKSASMRPKIMKGLASLHERAAKAGIDE